MKEQMKFLLRLVACCLVFSLSSGSAPMLAQSAQPVLASNAGEEEKLRSEIPKRLMRKFKRDAARLALRIEAKAEDLRYQNIIIPYNNIDNIYRLLTNIYMRDEKAKAIAKCNIHTFPNPSIDRLMLIFDRDVAWAAPLQEGISETESQEINELLDEFDLIIDKHVQWNDTQDAITIRSKEPLNMAALANEFYNIEGIKDIDLGIPELGGNDINVSRVHDGWEVEYVLRFGSYISGKGKMHFWKYRVLDNGDVQFVTEDGDPLPEWMRCHFEDETKLVFKG
ncbi:MAG: hypothetical protein AAGG75_06855 [Bacteroidota bacterium]